jgi:hypothetical protein
MHVLRQVEAENIWIGGIPGWQSPLKEEARGSSGAGLPSGVEESQKMVGGQNSGNFRGLERKNVSEARVRQELPAGRRGAKKGGTNGKLFVPGGQ